MSLLSLPAVTKLLEDPEFALLVAASARPPLPHHRAAIVAAATPGQIDWSLFLKLIARHRVAPLVFDALSDLRTALPEGVFGELRAKATADRIQALKTIGVLNIVQACLAKAGIDAVSVKGPTLAQLAFGDPTMRQCRDLDVLIPPDRVGDAVRALQAKGFRLAEHQGLDEPERLIAWMRLMKDLSLLHEATGTIVELHWRLTNNPHLLSDEVARSRQIVRLDKIEVPTLGTDDLLLYLCIHGAKHQWFRLKWLADINALLAQGGAGSREKLLAHAHARGVGIAVEQTLFVLDGVYGLASPAASTTRRGWLLGRLARRFLTQPEEPDGTRFGTTVMAIGQMGLRRELRYVRWEITMMLIDWPVVLAMNGKRFAYPVSIVGRPLFWVRRKVMPRHR